MFYMIRLLCFLIVAMVISANASATAQLRLATTTSIENSGLLDYLLPDFELLCDCRVRVLPVGSGKAMKLGERGDVDLLLTHAAKTEEEFIAAGYGVDRRIVMRNYFVLIGPPDDPANISSQSTIDAMRIIAEQNVRFISRGDDSGTHKKEEELWQLLDMSATDFAPSWYISAGVGMGQVLVMADQLRAYTLSDIGTFLFFRERTDLAILSLDEPQLANIYSVMRVNPQRNAHTQTELAIHFIEWLLSAPTQKKIGDYRLLGTPLFIPAKEGKHGTK